MFVLQRLLQVLMCIAVCTLQSTGQPFAKEHGSSGNRTSSKPSTAFAFFQFLKPSFAVYGNSSLIESENGSFRVLGNFARDWNGPFRPFNSRYDDNGAEIDSIAMPDSVITTVGAVGTKDGGYAVFAQIQSKPFESGSAILKYSMNDSLLWISSKEQRQSRFRAFDFLHTRDGGFAIAVSYTGDVSLDNRRGIALRKITSVGNSAWLRILPRPDTTSLNYDCTALVESRSGAFYVAGWVLSSAGFMTAWIMKTDSLGQLLWMKLYPGEGNDQTIQDLVEIDDGSLIACGKGNARPATTETSDACVWKIAPDGAILWQRYFGSPMQRPAKPLYSYNEFLSLGRTSDGGLLFAGQLQSRIQSNDSTVFAYLVKVDSEGAQRWSRNYRSGPTIPKQQDYFHQVSETRDGGIIILGRAYPYVPGGEYMLKTDSLGLVDGAEGITSAVPAATVTLSLDMPYPHPLDRRFPGIVRYSLTRPAMVRLSVHDALGREVRILDDAFREAGEHRVAVDADGLSVGIYLLRLSTSAESIARTVLVRK
jgi:hypothetical protein